MQGDHCLDAPCFHTKVNAHIDREIAARPELVQIEDGWRKPSEKRPDAVQRGQFREIETTTENPDAEPVAPCSAAKPAIIVFGKRVGTHITVCTDNNCPIHDPRAAARRAEKPAPVMAPSAPTESEEETQQRQAEYEDQQREYEAEREKENEERRQQFQREHEEMEAEAARRDEVRKQREATFDRIVANAPATLTAPQLRVILRAIVNLDPYTFADDLAEQMDEEREQRSTEEVLLAAIDRTADEKLTGFAVHLALAGHRGIPRENEFDFLTEAEAAFAPKEQKKRIAPRKQEQPTPIKQKPDTSKPKATAAVRNLFGFSQTLIRLSGAVPPQAHPEKTQEPFLSCTYPVFPQKSKQARYALSGPIRGVSLRDVAVGTAH